MPKGADLQINLTVERQWIVTAGRLLTGASLLLIHRLSNPVIIDPKRGDIVKVEFILVFSRRLPVSSSPPQDILLACSDGSHMGDLDTDGLQHGHDPFHIFRITA